MIMQFELVYMKLFHFNVESFAEFCRVAETADRQHHEDHEDSPPRAHSCNDSGICVCVYLCLVLQ